MRLRNTLSLALILLVGLQATAFGVALGDIEVSSAVNEPLQARIALVDLDDTELSEIVITEASLADYARLDITARTSSQTIALAVVSDSEGEYLSLSTQAPVNAAYLEIVLDTRWPSGRTLTAHTLLLEPPVFLEPAAQSSSTLGDTAVTPTQAIEEAGERQTITTNRLSTLYSIALAARPDTQVTVQQTMLAIQRLNPLAFADNNINGLYAGVVLRLPSREEITQLDTAEALSAVRRQNGEEQAVEEVTELAAEAAVVAPELSAQTDDQLSVVVQGQAEQSAEPELASRISELVNQLAVTQEELARAAREREEFLSRLASIESQIESAQEIIRLKDVQIAELTRALETASQPAARSQVVEQKLLWGFVTEAMALSVLAVLAIALLVLGLLHRGRKDEEPDEASEVISLAAEPVSAPAQQPSSQLEVEKSRGAYSTQPDAGAAESIVQEPAFDPEELAFGAQDSGQAPRARLELEEEEAATKLELAYAYHKMGDNAGAAEILLEVVAEGEGKHQEEARTLLTKIEGLKGSAN